MPTEGYKQWKKEEIAYNKEIQKALAKEKLAESVAKRAEAKRESARKEKERLQNKKLDAYDRMRANQGYLHIKKYK